MKAEEEKLIEAMARTIDSYAFVVPHGAGPYLTEYKKSFQRAARRDARRALSAIRAAGYCVMPEGAGTPTARWKYLMGELRNRFPSPNPFDSTKLPEDYILEAIDALRDSAIKPEPGSEGNGN